MKYFWTNCVRNELDWGSRCHTNMEFSTPSWSWTNLVNGKSGKKTKIKLAHALERVCGSLPNSCLVTVTRHEEVRVQVTFDDRGTQLVLEPSLCTSRVDTKELSRNQSYGALRRMIY